MDTELSLPLNIQEDKRHEWIWMNQGWVSPGWNGWVFVRHFFIFPSKVCPGHSLAWLASNSAHKPVSHNSSSHYSVTHFFTLHYIWEFFSQLPWKLSPFMRIIEIIDDFGGKYFAPQPKQLKDPFFKLILSNSHLEVVSQQAGYSLYLRASSYFSPWIPKHFIWRNISLLLQRQSNW